MAENPLIFPISGHYTQNLYAKIHIFCVYFGSKNIHKKCVFVYKNAPLRGSGLPERPDESPSEKSPALSSREVISGSKLNSLEVGEMRWIFSHI